MNEIGSNEIGSRHRILLVVFVEEA